MQLNKLLKNNTFLINACSCLVVVLSICYLGLNLSVKETYSADTCDGVSIMFEDGPVCFTTQYITSGKYRWNEEMSVLDGLAAYNMNYAEYSVNFVSSNGNKEFSRLQFSYFQNDTYDVTGIVYGGGNEVITVVTSSTPVKIDDAGIEYYSSRICDGAGDSYYCTENDRIFHIKDSLVFEATLDTEYNYYVYNWFIKNTKPYNQCYYKNNAGSKEYIWTNIPETGIVYSQYTTQEACEAANELSDDIEINFGDYKVVDNYIIVDVGTTKTGFQNNITVEGEPTYKYSNELTATLFTGLTLEVRTTDEKVANYAFVVLGDVTGSNVDGLCDGKITSSDFVEIYHYFNKDLTLDGAYLMASDYNQDGITSSTDFVEIYHYLNKGEK